MSMKKIILLVALTVIMTTKASAQSYDSDWTLNTRLWTTNYFAASLYDLAEGLVKAFAFEGNKKDSILADRIIPDCDLIFPIGLQKKGFEGAGDIYGPYHYAFGNPFKHIGDYSVGLDVSYHPSVVGAYAGAYFKSQEIVFKSTDDNLRGFYFQPRAGLIFGNRQHSFEAGVFYDVLTGCGGSWEIRSIYNEYLMSPIEPEKDMLEGGLGLDFAFSTTDKAGIYKTSLQFSMPLHNFINEDYHNGLFHGLKRRVGYISLTQRIRL